MAEFDPGRPALALTKELRELGTAERAAQEKRYLKSDLKVLRRHRARHPPDGQGHSPKPRSAPVRRA
jgi:hypothetical protein